MRLLVNLLVEAFALQFHSKESDNDQGKPYNDEACQYPLRDRLGFSHSMHHSQAHPAWHICLLFLITFSLLCLPSGAQTDESKLWKTYMEASGEKVKKHWLAQQADKPGRTIVAWKIHRDGTISDVTIKSCSRNKSADLAAVAAVKAAAPFDPLPNSRADFVDIEYDFESVRRSPLNLTVSQALKRYGRQGKEKIAGKFARAGLLYPPRETTWICLKEEKLILVFARNANGKWKQVACCPFVSASGALGPKLAEGDMQVPEGIYRPTRLDAMTHLCLWLDYPNRTDQANARIDKRTNLGGAIQIHEGICSTGCIVINHDDMAQLFVLANDVRCSNVNLLIAPCNLLAKNPTIDFARQPKWLPKLYKDLKKAMSPFPIDTASCAPSSSSARRG